LFYPVGGAIWAFWGHPRVISSRKMQYTVGSRVLLGLVPQPGLSSLATVDAVFEVIKNTLVAGERVVIAGFGSFRVRDRAARTINNPRTGEPMQIPAKKVISFKPGKFLRL